MDCDCGVVLNIPWWTDRAIAAAAFVIGLGITFICYLKKEAARYKNFYGKEDKISKKEIKVSAAERQRENEMEAAAMGAYAGDVIVTRTTPFDPNEEPSKFKVMVAQKLYQKVRKCTPVPGVVEKAPKTVILPSPDSPFKIVLQVDSDKTGRAEELLTELNKERCSVGDVKKVLETTVDNIHEIIEKMTGKSFLVIGVTLDGDKKTIVVGGEHLDEHADELTLQMKLQMLQPFKAFITAYQAEVARPKLDPPAQNDNLPMQTVTEHIQTDVTPQMTPMKSSQPQPSYRQSAVVLRGETPTNQPAVAPPPSSSPQKENGSKQTVAEPNQTEMKLSALRKALETKQSKTKTPRATVNRSAKKVKESSKTRMAQPLSGGSQVKQVSQTKMTSKNVSKYDSKDKSKEKTAPFTPSMAKKKMSSKEGGTAAIDETKNAENSAPDKITANLHHI